MVPRLRAFIVLPLALALFPAGAATQQPAQPDEPPQQTAPVQEQPAVSPEEADIAITATVTAREVRFEQEPEVRIEFPGRPERVTDSRTERTNLPQKVQPGVTYRDIGIRLKIASVFADIDRIVAEALGEVTVSEPEPVTEPAPPPPSPEGGGR